MDCLTEYFSLVPNTVLSDKERGVNSMSENPLTRMYRTDKVSGRWYFFCGIHPNLTFLVVRSRQSIDYALAEALAIAKNQPSYTCKTAGMRFLCASC